MNSSLNLAFAALADPTRRAIVARLARGDASVNELAAPHAMSQPAISKHLKVLARAGLISRSRDGKYRPCRLETAPLQAVEAWAERFRSMWEERFAALDGVLDDLKAQERAKTRTEK